MRPRSGASMIAGLVGLYGIALLVFSVLATLRAAGFVDLEAWW